ncbi:acyl-CoA thioesterase [Rhabdothermincola salaria]|uniref:acyl-CoA thioesterase n=1 Tax=Rhabdothermincola salaria TaxID=2903142 RepID=UPI001E3CF938|nr:thioesterase family protein [Rhabdothermincola salaria]
MTVSLPPPEDLKALLTLDPVKPDAFLAPTADNGWGRIYGGQAIAQGLRAAGHTVGDGQLPHSLHAYFIREGDEKAPVLYEVERIRDGRSFSTRQVVAYQAGGAISTLIASFHLPEESEDAQRSHVPADAPAPLDVPAEPTDLFFETRPTRIDAGPARWAWMRATEDLGDDPALHACALAYLSDEHLLGAALSAHSGARDWESLMTASLDHAIWFHRPFRIDDWVLFDLHGHGNADARAFATSLVFDAAGRQIATVAQEGLARARRPAPGAP